MHASILVTPYFESQWPLTVQLVTEALQRRGYVVAPALRIAPEGAVPPACDVVNTTLLIGLGWLPADADWARFPNLRQAAFPPAYGRPVMTPMALEWCRKQGITLVEQHVGAFWGQSVAECALALTLGALRRIPQRHQAMTRSHAVWDFYTPGACLGNVESPGEQFCDGFPFVSGTLCGKRVRVAGMGGIGARFAGFSSALGAEVVAADPHAADVVFTGAGARRVWHLDELMSDAEIFAMMIPEAPDTYGVITAELVDALPQGTLVVLMTRAAPIDMTALRRRVVAGELALAVDVYDVEPVPLNDPLLGLDHVVHTPHIAGRTRHSSCEWAESLVARFRTA